MLAERVPNSVGRSDQVGAIVRAGTGVLLAHSEREAIERLAGGVSALGWSRVHVALFEDWRIVTETSVGDGGFGEESHRTAKGWSDRFGDGASRSALGRSYFMPIDKLPSEGPWQEGDRAWVPIVGVLGSVLGCITLDRPASRQRPTADDLEGPEFFADLGARAIEALRRHEGQRFETLGRLAEGVAHDYNNLLTVIQGQAEMAQRMIERANPAHDAVLGVEQAAQQACDIVGTLLEYTRQASLDQSTVDLRSLIDEMTPMLGRITPTSICVSFESCASVDPMVRISPTRIRQMLINLVLNARDAIRGVGEIRIRLEQGADPTSARVRLTVRDNGSGIDKDTIGRVFDRDFSSREDGFGLGLAIVRDIVHEHGGDIEISSTPGEGTTVSIELARCSEQRRLAG